MRNIVLGIVVAAPLFAVAPAVAQQIVDTTTGVRHASGQCSVTEAMLAAIEQGQADRQVDTKARLDAFIAGQFPHSRKDGRSVARRFSAGSFRGLSSDLESFASYGVLQSSLLKWASADPSARR